MTFQLERDVLKARAFGFGGKLCIHPKQVAAVNKFFLPSLEEQIWAEKILLASTSQAGEVSFSCHGSATKLSAQLV